MIFIIRNLFLYFNKLTSQLLNFYAVSGVSLNLFNNSSRYFPFTFNFQNRI